jgi:uncharacterized protein (DUF849 family)
MSGPGPHAIRRLKVCLNGGRRRSEHPALPVTPTELATAARAAVEAGAEAIHLHPRAPDGSESLLAADVGPAVATVRRSCPGVPIGVSTGLWITHEDVRCRLSQVSHWAEFYADHRPDFASVNLSEPGYAELTRVLAEAWIGVEAGVWSVSDAEALAGVETEFGPLRILVEILDAGPDRAVEQATRVLAAVRASGSAVPVLLHGERQACWPLVREAGRLGLATRIGLEDVVTGPDGEPVCDNAQLVELALREWESARQTSGKVH